MSFLLFDTVFPEVAETETKTVTCQRSGLDYPGIAAGDYYFKELFCTIDDCDCRWAMILVLNQYGKVMATLSYGWESPEFYSEWMGGDEEFGRETAGVELYRMQIQSENCLAFRDLFRNIIENDRQYAKRIQKHYSQMRRELRSSPEAREKFKELIPSL